MFDFQVLLKDLEAKGLPMAEADAKMVTEAVLDWAAAGCLADSNAFVKAGGALIPVLKPVILQLEDGIDGVKGN